MTRAGAGVVLYTRVGVVFIEKLALPADGSRLLCFSLPVPKM
jgi:hypothetical protein